MNKIFVKNISLIFAFIFIFLLIISIFVWKNKANKREEIIYDNIIETTCVITDKFKKYDRNSRLDYYVSVEYISPYDGSKIKKDINIGSYENYWLYEPSDVRKIYVYNENVEFSIQSLIAESLLNNYDFMPSLILLMLTLISFIIYANMYDSIKMKNKNNKKTKYKN